jgi:delta8-fatty-acid desaturase
MGPWPNMTPPIRRATQLHNSVNIPDLSAEAVRFDEEKRISGVFSPGAAGDAKFDTLADLPTLTLTDSAGSEGSVDDEKQCLQTACQYESTSCSRRTSSTHGTTTPQRPGSAHEVQDEKADLLPSALKRLSPDEYTSWAIQQGKHLDIRSYPSLDQAVQQDITQKYMKLHDQIVDEGLYKCRYIEYGKEMVRYTSLFALSMTALYHSWYLTSAVFLGLFWVCLLPTTYTTNTMIFFF